MTDNPLVEKVMTFKSGNFPFSRNYDRQALAVPFAEARVLTRTVAELPILPSLASKLDQEVIIKSIFSTAALEGNPLSEEEVEEIVIQDNKEDYNDKARREIQNLISTYAALDKMDNIHRYPKTAFGEEVIKLLHYFATQGLDHPLNEPGAYRNHRVQVGDKGHGGIYTPPKNLVDIQTLMAKYEEWVKSDALIAEGPLVRAALAHYHLGIIHPFADGNGRVARLVEAFLLRTEGFKYIPQMLSNFYYRYMDDYYWAFSLCLKSKDHDVTPFVEFALKVFSEALYDLRDKITAPLRRFAIRDHIAHSREERRITKRQHDLLAILLDNPTTFSLRDLSSAPSLEPLYRNVSERTARRDIKRLEEMHLLIKDQNGKYTLNLRGLDAR